MDYAATRAAVVAYLRAGYTARTIYADPPGDDLAAADEARGWVELQWRPGTLGLDGGRMGPDATEYLSSYGFTMRVLMPRAAGGDTTAWDAAWAAVDALTRLAIEAQIGQLYLHTVDARPIEVEDGDTHVQVDVEVVGTLESIKAPVE